MTSQEKNFYEVLECKPSDSIETIKKSYQTLLLRHHPDKQMQQNRINVDKSNNLGELSVQIIDKAWKVLKDPKLRRIYNAEMEQRKYNDKPIVHDILTPKDFMFDINDRIYSHDCRCGGYFIIPNELITNNDIHIDSNHIDEDIFIGCDECSLVIQLTSEKS